MNLAVAPRLDFTLNGTSWSSPFKQPVLAVFNTDCSTATASCQHKPETRKVINLVSFNVIEWAWSFDFITSTPLQLVTHESNAGLIQWNVVVRNCVALLPVQKERGGFTKVDSSTTQEGRQALLSSIYNSIFNSISPMTVHTLTLCWACVNNLFKL